MLLGWQQEQEHVDPLETPMDHAQGKCGIQSLVQKARPMKKVQSIARHNIIDRFLYNY
jgi:hypothetical protein